MGHNGFSILANCSWSNLKPARGVDPKEQIKPLVEPCLPTHTAVFNDSVTTVCQNFCLLLLTSTVEHLPTAGIQRPITKSKIYSFISSLILLFQLNNSKWKLYHWWHCFICTFQRAPNVDKMVWMWKETVVTCFYITTVPVSSYRYWGKSQTLSVTRALHRSPF